MTKTQTTERPIRVGLISLGCAKNLVDAELMLGALLKEGMEVVNDARQADALLVNTCSFVDAAKAESVDAVLESAALRDRQRPEQALIVAGCLPQRFQAELPSLLPEVDAFLGIDQVTQVPDLIRQALRRRAERRASWPPQTPGAKGETIPRAHAPPRRGSQISNRKSQIPSPNCPPPSPIENRKSKIENQKSPIPPPPLVDLHRRPHFLPEVALPRFRLTPPHFAYVKIAEGCNHPCSFCAIPRIRGPHRSRPQADLVQEARQLLAEGVRELNLISQDSTYYGFDLRPRAGGAARGLNNFQAAVRQLPADAPTLCTLLRELNRLPGEFWVRLLYTHPAHWTDELIHTMAECPKVARYVDLPLQHIHSNMLERMRRETSREFIVDLLQRLRAGVAGVTLRTTFIVGFPGETEACFHSLLEFIRHTRFERLGVFTYSREEGTRAARMAGQVPDQIKNRRRDLAMAEQHRIARAVSASFVGKTIKVLVEGEAPPEQWRQANLFSWEHGQTRAPGGLWPKGEAPPWSTRGARCLMVARSEADAPDIDGRVYVRGPLPIGQFAQVQIVGHTDYDLLAEPVGSQGKTGSSL